MWTEPSTRAAGDVITATIWNAMPVGDLKHLATSSGFLRRTVGGIEVSISTAEKGMAIVATSSSGGWAQKQIFTTNSSGTLKHEYGGVEADISAIALGGLVRGSGTGTMSILAVGANPGDSLQVSSSGGLKYAGGAKTGALAATQTSTTATLANITALSFAGASSEVYDFSVTGFYTHASSGVQIAWALPTGAVFTAVMLGANSLSGEHVRWSTTRASITLDDGATLQFAVFSGHGAITFGDAGTAQLQFAKVVDGSTTNPVTILAGARVTAIKVV